MSQVDQSHCTYSTYIMPCTMSKDTLEQKCVGTSIKRLICDRTILERKEEEEDDAMDTTSPVDSAPSDDQNEPDDPNSDVDTSVACKHLLTSTLAVSIFRYAQSAHFRTGEALLVAAQYQLTHAEVDRLLRKNENSKSLQTSAFVQSYDYNHLPANSPCEDQHADGYCRLNNSYYFGVFDGHAGPQCAKAVAGRLYDYLAVSILPENVLKEIYCGADFSSVDILETS
uniref:PPM-type phosphatase domain-containing protein n=1 Tax=Trichuris muris TaxID=70415 RepID=A0A5S6QB26_TRIMR